MYPRAFFCNLFAFNKKDFQERYECFTEELSKNTNYSSQNPFHKKCIYIFFQSRQWIRVILRGSLWSALVWFSSFLQLWLKHDQSIFQVHNVILRLFSQCHQKSEKSAMLSQQFGNSLKPWKIIWMKKVPEKISNTLITIPHYLILPTFCLIHWSCIFTISDTFSAGFCPFWVLFG